MQMAEVVLINPYVMVWQTQPLHVQDQGIPFLATLKQVAEGHSILPQAFVALLQLI